MLALCVDDEEALLSELVRAVSAADGITETVAFRRYSEALEWAGEHRPDVAFLDIRLRGHTGLELAQHLKEQYPDLPVVFCTGYREFAFEAIQLHVAGYLLKPITAAAVQRELDHVTAATPAAAERLTVRCFGNFEVLKDGKPLHFKRKRSKEVLAYLVDRRGATVTAKEMCAVLWEDDFNDEKNVQHLYKLVADMKATLTEAGFPDVFIRHNYDYAVNTEKLDCDYFRYLVGDPAAEKQFCGEYMAQYSWAEETAALL